MLCLIPVTNQGGMVSTATLIPKYVVPQTIATVIMAKISLKSFSVFIMIFAVRRYSILNKESF